VELVASCCNTDAVIGLEPWAVERRSDGAVLVRMRSRESSAGRLPDAVFAFRLGDPQYHYWEQQLSGDEG
jgi:hypothetical protein